jgi:hypothetical protein
MIRRVERLETRLGLKRPRLQFNIRFIEPDGTVASSYLLHEGGGLAALANTRGLEGDHDRLNQVRPRAPLDRPEQKTPPGPRSPERL